MNKMYNAAKVKTSKAAGSIPALLALFLVFSISLTPVKGQVTPVVVSPSTANVCLNGGATLLTASGGVLANYPALTENFNGASNDWTTINNSVFGVTANADWTLQPNGYTYNSITFNSNDASQFYLSNSEDQGAGTTATILQSPPFSLANYTSVNLSFWHYYKHSAAGESAIVEASTDGFSWNVLATYTSNQGLPGTFVNANLNMNAYAGEPLVFIRFRYDASVGFWWAVDNINVSGNVATAVTWTANPAAPNSMFTDAGGSVPYIAGTDANSIYVKPGVATIYTATATAPAPCNCSNSGTASLTVSPPVSVTITASANPVCPSSAVTFTSAVINGGPNPSYQWQVNGANQATTPNFTYSPSNGDQVTVTVNGNGACTFGNPATSNTITMTVATAPVGVTISANPGNYICIGTSVTFTATPSNGGTSPTYQWRIDGINVIGATNPTFTTSTLTNGQAVTCKIVSNSACIQGSDNVVSGQILMTVNDYGPVSVLIGRVGSGPICAGTVVTVRASPLNGGLAPSYEFFKNGVSQGLQASNDYTFTPINGDKIRVRIKSNYICLTGLDTARSNTLTLVVVPIVAASVTLSNSAALCTGTPISFTANPTNPGTTPMYDFLVNGVSQQNSASATFTLSSPANGNTVQVIMTSSYSCATGNPASSAIYTVALNASPNITSLVADCNNILPGSGQQVTLTATATAGGSATITNYQWLLGGSPISGANGLTYTTNIAGTYTFSVTNSNSCTTTSSPVVLTSNGGPLAGGSYTIPFTGCSGFNKVSSAVDYINTWGIAGPVIFNITPAYTETAPPGGYALTATGTAANTITFQRNGAGANPIITAGLQVAGSNNDGIFKLIGSDYTTIKDITLQENPANTVTATGASNTMTEWGIALLYATAANGPNHNTIQNNSISLNKAYPNSFGIYSNLRHSAAAPSVSADIGSNTGGMNKIYGNAISNINNPILMLGAGANMTQGNDIGGSSPATANTITDWGTNTVNSGGTTFFGVPATLAAIYAANQTDLNISWNSITSATGVNTGAAGFYGILTDFVGTAPSGTFTNTTGNNTIQLNSAAVTGAYEAIRQSNTVASAAIAGITLNINNNTISSILSGVASTVTVSAIVNAFPAGTLDISNNILKGNTSTATTGGFAGITNTAAVLSNLSINNNQFGDGSGNAISFSAATSGPVQAILNTGAAGASVLSINNNSFTKFVHTVPGASDHTYISNTALPATQNINNNSFTNITVSSSGTITGISSTGAGANKVISGNSFSNITGSTGDMILINAAGGSTLADINNNNIGNNVANSISSTGSITGINLTNGAGISSVTANIISGLSQTGSSNAVVNGINTAAPTATLGSNNINSLNSSGNNSVLNGILVTAGTTVTANLNTVRAFNGTGSGTVSSNGIWIDGGTNVVVSRNKIADLAEQTAVGGPGVLVNGILLNGGATVTVHNNFISELKAPAANINDAIHGISIPSSLAGSTYKLYYNSIYLNATSTGTNFGTTGIFHTGNTTATTATLDMRNNILDNESAASGTGLTVAFRKGNSTLANYAAASDNNLFFAGSTAIPGLLFYDGTNSESTITGLQAILTGRDGSSLTAQPVFASSTDLHLTTTDNCGLNGAGTPVPGITIDIDSDTRDASTPDIGADEFNGSGGGAGVWKGVNSNWNDPQNWCGLVPTAGMNVTIAAGSSFYPVITDNQPVAKNISILPGGSVSITGSGKLTIYGTISNTGVFAVSDGTIEMKGSVAQVIPADAFSGDSIKNLVISNGSVSLGGTLDLFGRLSFTGNNRTFATNGFLTLKSNASGTASVADISSNNVANNNNQVTGDVTVERFIRAKRAWHFLSVPTQQNLQSIHEAWQENQAAGVASPAGYGIQISSNIPGWAAAGFDMYSPGGPSVKTYVPASNSWAGIPATTGATGKFATAKAYMAFIRGDRTINTFGPPPNTTVLRDKGALVTNNYGPVPVGAGEFAAIGNPYASAIDFAKILPANRTNLQDVYYLWDPQLGQYGGYVTFAGPGYNPSASVSYTGGNRFIESGQAFFVHSSGAAGSLAFTEQIKEDGSNLVSRPANNLKQLRTNLYVISAGTPYLYDGVVTEYDRSYSNRIDVMDALKLVNFGENLAIRSGGKTLSVERRSGITETDTIFYNLAQVRVQSYRFEFEAENLDPRFTGFLEDSYLNTSTVVNMAGVTKVDFTVTNDAGSYAPGRFRLVFRQVVPVPVTFTSVRANRKQEDVLVEWKVDNQLNIQHYEVERSQDGRSFNKASEQPAQGSGAVSYNWLDNNPYPGDNFYRIRSIGLDNEVKFSEVVKVNMAKGISLIAIYPNPVGEDGIIYVNLENLAAGNYQVRLLDSKGQTILRKTVNHTGGSSVYQVRLEKLVSHGHYILVVHGDNSLKQTFKIIY